MRPPKPRIAITMGDPAGIGPEICLQLLHGHAVDDVCVPLVFGDAAILERVAEAIGVPLPGRVCSLAGQNWQQMDEPCIVDFEACRADSIVPGQVNATAGRASYDYVIGGIDAAVDGTVDAICTAPISKEALQKAGIGYPGHTEILADKTKSDRICMMLTSDQISCCLVTTHVGIADVPGLLTRHRIEEVIELGAAAMLRLRGRAPRLVVCGLNPHAGEHGLFGHHEEETIIAPAVEAARAKGIDAVGPISPDAAFLPGRRQQTDLYICMYHDQGLIPLKALAFDVAVNVTLGLPIVRTSVDHGTAYDIAWQGRAQITSLIQAVRWAARASQSARS